MGEHELIELVELVNQRQKGVIRELAVPVGKVRAVCELVQIIGCLLQQKDRPLGVRGGSGSGDDLSGIVSNVIAIEGGFGCASSQALSLKVVKILPVHPKRNGLFEFF